MTFQDYNISIPGNRKSGEVATICPQCSHTRKKKSDKCLGVNLDKRIWRCNHCNWSGYLKDEKVKFNYIKPEWHNRTALDDKLVKWFETRGIRQATLNRLLVTQGRQWMPQVEKEMNVIEFNYFKAGELVNVKYRDGKKNFKLVKDAELVFYNLDAIVDEDECVIVEGEMDCLAMAEAGIYNTVSVPNGANLNSNNLAYLDNCIDWVFNKKKIYLALDNDIAGRKLRDELAERLGMERCVYIEFKDCKDANECLLKYGIQGIIESKNAAKEFPLEGVFTISDFSNAIDDMYEFGLDKGVNLEIQNFALNIVKGYITTVTGIPSHGKSDFVDNICIHLKIKAGWNGAFYSPENKPTELHFSKIARKLTGKSWEGDWRMSRGDIQDVKDYLEKSFWFIKPEKDFTLDTILNSVRILKQRHGIDFFVIDAWNKLEHRYGDNETKHIGESLDKLAVFCEINNVHCFLIAHPRKMEKEKDGMSYKVPTLYDIAGSAHFYNKTDNGITVYRDFQTHKTHVYIQKVKFDHWGRVGVSEYQYKMDSGRYFVDISDSRNWIRQHEYREPLVQKIDDEEFNPLF